MNKHFEESHLIKHSIMGSDHGTMLKILHNIYTINGNFEANYNAPKSFPPL